MTRILVISNSPAGETMSAPGIRALNMARVLAAQVPRAEVTLATKIPEEKCRRINLGYRKVESVRLEDYAGREDEGILLVPKAGEMLFQLKHPPKWAGGDGNGH